MPTTVHELLGALRCVRDELQPRATAASEAAAARWLAAVPADVAAVIERVFEEVCGGDSLLLRATLARLETLEYSLRLATVCEAAAKLCPAAWLAFLSHTSIHIGQLGGLVGEGAALASGDSHGAEAEDVDGDDEMTDIAAATSPTDETGIDGEVCGGVSCGTSVGGCGARAPTPTACHAGGRRRITDLTPAEAAAVAAHVRQRRAAVAVPVLPRGAGSNFKLVPSHLLILHQLVLLLRYAVNAHPHPHA